MINQSPKKKMKPTTPKQKSHDEEDDGEDGEYDGVGKRKGMGSKKWSSQTKVRGGVDVDTLYKKMRLMVSFPFLTFLLFCFLFFSFFPDSDGRR